MKFHTPQTLAQLAEKLGIEYIGPADHVVTGLNEIHRVEPGDITFVDVKKYFNKALNSAATTIILNERIDPPAGKGLLLCEDPFSIYNRIGELMQPTMPLDTVGAANKIHPSARIGRNVVIGENVEIGEGTEIGHNTVIGSHVHIGAHTRIYGNVTVCDHVLIGSHCCIGAGVVLGGEAFYFKKRDYGRDKMLTKGRVVIADHVDIGANTTIDRGVSADTMIGEYTKIDNLVQVGHDTVIGKRVLIAAQVGIAGVCNIEDDVILWGQSGIPSDKTIGRGAVVLAQSGILNDVEPGKTMLGSPATEAKQQFREIASVAQLPELLRRLNMEE